MAIAFQHLVRMPNGDTEITGRGVRVYTILCLQKTGDTPERIAEGYDLPLAAVLEALAYAADYPDEMEAIRKVEADMTREWLSTVLKHLRRDIPKEVCVVSIYLECLLDNDLARPLRLQGHLLYLTSELGVGGQTDEAASQLPISKKIEFLGRAARLLTPEAAHNQLMRLALFASEEQGEAYAISLRPI